ncbi:DUF819 domain-containing protein [Runella sp.]|jgi:uncharacterized membrane protein|uniref:DUF819 family protein n=1 Tax=Runella sp. TaxID=1960881 RepID=UPI002612FDD9|nr:DUF819 family protein [Runella sp.]
MLLSVIFTSDATVLGLLLVVLALVFYTASLKHPIWQKFYAIFPPLLLCYFIPGLLNSFGVISGEESKLYSVISQYFLPACLVYFTLGMDFKAVIRLGPKALIVFFAGTLGVMIGGPVAVWVMKMISPEVVGGVGADSVWRGLATIAGSWIGGGANQTALKEIFQPSDRLFSQVIAVDVITAEIWMAVLIYGAGFANKIDRIFKADASAIEELKDRIDSEQKVSQRIPTVYDLVLIAAVGFGVTGLAHFFADYITPWIKINHPSLERFSLTSSFFWVVSIATMLGILLSFTRLRQLEFAGASRIGSLFLYILVATIGMKMDIFAVAENPGLFGVGIIWMSVHVMVTLGVAKLIRAPFFFTAVGSQANIGGAASAPVVAAAFHPSLASVGVLLAILGYAVGTYGGYLTGLMMQWVAE